ncbi:hypothetical protein GTA08_BOTSDO12132 [Botryosphaeria dothidea]|uniref:Uncharacterized protein n=1 Tax=Botryosphaeria dothidea TaxID=55169 RepID=A0A8H4J5K5_9PEZI|nr:hypothetical protein GTA08_BOTSDO12132 [Botryosphaeria dothidea]
MHGRNRHAQPTDVATGSISVEYHDDASRSRVGPASPATPTDQRDWDKITRANCSPLMASDYLQLEKTRPCTDNPRHSPEIQAFFPAVGPATSTQSNTGDIQLPLSQRYNNTTQVAIDNALELTIGLWLMLYMGPSDSSVFTGRSNFKWSSGFTLRQAIDNNFPRIPVPPSAISGKYRPELKAHNLERVGTIKIKWTRNLTDHLALDEEWGTLILYHFADFLRLLEGSSIER